MREVFSGEVYEVMPITNGIIFSYQKETIDENVVIAYKMLSFDSNRFTDVAKNIYMITKFGNNYKSVAAYCDNYITVKSIILPGGRVFLLHNDGTAQLIDADGSLVWSGMITYRTYVPSDITIVGNALWACYSDCNVMLRYNITTIREELRIGGSKSPFDKPRNMFAEGENVMVSNQGSKKLIQINLTDYSILEFESFDEPVYQYVKVGDYRFVVLQSGLYLI